MCCGTPRSSASSPIVRKARSLLLWDSAAKGSAGAGDPLAHDLAGAEGQHPPRRDRHFDAGLGIAADPLALVAQDEAAEAGNLHILAIGERAAHMGENALDDAGGFGAGEADLAMDDVGK